MKKFSELLESVCRDQDNLPPANCRANSAAIAHLERIGFLNTLLRLRSRSLQRESVKLFGRISEWALLEYAFETGMQNPYGSIPEQTRISGSVADDISLLFHHPFRAPYGLYDPMEIRALSRLAPWGQLQSGKNVSAVREIWRELATLGTVRERWNPGRLREFGVYLGDSGSVRTYCKRRRVEIPRYTLGQLGISALDYALKTTRCIGGSDCIRSLDEALDFLQREIKLASHDLETINGAKDIELRDLPLERQRFVDAALRKLGHLVMSLRKAEIEYENALVFALSHEMFHALEGCKIGKVQEYRADEFAARAYSERSARLLLLQASEGSGMLKDMLAGRPPHIAFWYTLIGAKVFHGNDVYPSFMSRLVRIRRLLSISKRKIAGAMEACGRRWDCEKLVELLQLGPSEFFGEDGECKLTGCRVGREAYSSGKGFGVSKLWDEEVSRSRSCEGYNSLLFRARFAEYLPVGFRSKWPKSNRADECIVYWDTYRRYLNIERGTLPPIEQWPVFDPAAEVELKRYRAFPQEFSVVAIKEEGKVWQLLDLGWGGYGDEGKLNVIGKRYREKGSGTGQLTARELMNCMGEWGNYTQVQVQEAHTLEPPRGWGSEAIWRTFVLGGTFETVAGQAVIAESTALTVRLDNNAAFNWWCDEVEIFREAAERAMPSNTQCEIGVDAFEGVNSMGQCEPHGVDMGESMWWYNIDRRAVRWLEEVTARKRVSEALKNNEEVRGRN